MKARLGSMTAGLAVGITLAVAGACAAGAYLYSQRHFKTLLDGARGTALAQAELIRAALEHAMVRQDRTLLEPMIRAFGNEPRVAGVMLVDRAGVVRYSSGPLVPGHQFDLHSPTCQACHRYPPAQRTSSRVIETGGGDTLRTVVPVRNREACHPCHDPAQKYNGIVIVDVDASGIRAAADRDLRWMVGTTAGVALGLVAAIALVVRLVVLRRLQRFETTARLIAGGDLERRVPSAGSDTISWLAREFNAMADSVTGLLGEVRSQRERLETVINSIDDGIVVLDAKRTVLAANDAFIARTGRGRRDVLGCACATAPSGPAMCGVSDCPTVACLESGERQVRLCERRRSDGTVAWEEVHACRIADDAGTGVQIVEVWRDITGRRAAEARLAESHRLASLGMLASGFSHEMNTPLATVLMCVEGIAREMRRDGAPADLSRVAGHAVIAREQLLRCRGITQHFLRMSRGQASQGEVVDVAAALDAVVSLVEPTARDHGVTIDRGPIGPGPVQVRADESDLQQALINLLLNAVQASRRGGTVTLRVSGTDAVTILIADEGCGIPPDQQARIFEPFFSLRRGGTGLGLFVSLNSVRKWGGDILVRSAPDAGATFQVVLPILPAAAPRQAVRG